MNNLTKFGELWQQWEDQIIRDFYPTLGISVEMLAKLPHRGKSAIQKRANIIGVKSGIFWQEWEDDLIRACYKLPETRLELYEKLRPRTREAIISRDRILGIKAIALNKLWEDWEDDIIKKHYPSLSVRQEMLDMLPHRKLAAIQARASTLGVSLEDGSWRRKNSVNTHFFSAPNLLNSYWAGFIAADGYVGRGRTLVINISAKDKAHLQQFRDDIGFGGSIKDYQSPGYTNGMMCQLRIESKTIVADLERNFRVLPRKTFSLQFPRQLSKDNQLAYIAGYIDGDGAIGISSRHKGTRKDIALQVTGTEDVLSVIKEYVDSYNTTTPRLPRFAKVYPDSRCPRVFCYHVRGSRFLPFALDVQQLCRAGNVPLMNRKWGKIKEYLDILAHANHARS